MKGLKGMAMPGMDDSDSSEDDGMPISTKGQKSQALSTDKKCPCNNQDNKVARHRIQRDLEDFVDSEYMTIVWEKCPVHPEKRNDMKYTFNYKADETSPYEGIWVRFLVEIPDNYPNDKPTVICLEKLFHPNLDKNSGDVCSKVLTSWKVNCTLNDVH